MLAELRPAAVLLAFFTALTGLLYPAAITGIAQVLFPRQANGSLVLVDGRLVGSSLVGQPFAGPEYLWGRLSATAKPYDASASAGSNLGPSNPALAEAVHARVAALRSGGAVGTIPADLGTASGSGLDPHVSPAAAAIQIPRIARTRGLPDAAVAAVVAAHTEGRTLGIFGEPRVNVLAVNLALDAQTRASTRTGGDGPFPPPTP